MTDKEDPSEEESDEVSASGGELRNDDSKQRLSKRLSRYARSMTDFYLPQIKGRVTELENRTGDQAYVEQLFTERYLRGDWKSLRERVLKDPGAEGPNATNIRQEGVQHLESNSRVLDRRIEDLKKEQVTEFEHQQHWRESTDEEDSDSVSQEKREEVLQSIERRLEEVEEKLSFARYRRSLMETMLTQVAHFDYIQSWSEFWGGGGASANSHGTPEESLEANPEGLDSNQKKTILIGKALKYFREKNNRLPRFDKNKDLYEWALNIPHEELSMIQGSAVGAALRNMPFWVSGKSGKPGANLREIMNGCISYAESRKWKLPDEKEKELKDIPVESI